MADNTLGELGSLLGPVGGIAGGALGGLIGLLTGDDEDSKASAARQKALDAILNVKLPELNQQQLNLAQYNSAGQLTPETLGTTTQQDSELGNITTDPRLREAQMKSLSTLEDLGATGLSLKDRQALMDIRNKTAGDSQAAQASIMQNMAARGQAGGGQELAARLLAGQQGANRASSEGMSVASQAQQRALDSISQAGMLGTNIQGQDFNQAAQKASAQDLINKFNATNRQAVMGTNVGTRNAAQATNLATKQSLNNANTDVANKQQQYNKELLQQQYTNQLSQAKAAADAQNTAGNQHAAQAASTRGTWGDIGQGVGQAASALGSYYAKQKTADPTDEEKKKTLGV